MNFTPQAVGLSVTANAGASDNGKTTAVESLIA
jgi:hypothetical protein